MENQEIIASLSNYEIAVCAREIRSLPDEHYRKLDESFRAMLADAAS